ncbi:VCBS repeat-containing protein [Polaribacter sp. 11A2H]|uniref:VCBS repeat-containing protein n=1 Tax=Polaribacter sp. 11A2H TaxID=2687290 RepID=UPI00140DD2C3|nr:VCBS repeat-containing protein [Polaribacter sp. 11A2H]
MFTYINSSESNITFKNTITENDTLNVVNFQYVYNGGGVGIGDFNNDGLSDVVFTGNQVSSKIYLNQKDLKFKDISKAAGFVTNSWVTGVAIVDINADGWDDIYLSVAGINCKNNCNNLLFVNQKLNEKGIPTFKEQAAAYNLNDGNYSQQAVFLDYDSDGDLDVFIAHNGNVKFDKNSPVPKHYMPKNLADYLLRNDKVAGVNHPVFTNVSDTLGITYKGFSLGVNVQDLNNDNLPDIYVSNDFITEDLVYLNKGIDAKTKKHLGFKEANKQFFNHLTYNAMGVDIADVNNDELPDVMVVDMLPQSYQRQKSMLGSMNYDKYLISKRNNYTPQFMHNTLQLHNGFVNDSILKSSEIGNYAGISSTDWSWAPILADFDNDGDKDMYITNGYAKDITDLDFINYSNQSTLFGTEESKSKKLSALLAKTPSVSIPNYFYQNNTSLKFTDVSTDWVSKENSLSNGAAYADFDNDGDLDLVVNNLNQEAFLIKNNTIENFPKSNYLKIELKGNKENKDAIGAKVTLWSHNKVQQQYQSKTRGYLSSVESKIHFGLKDSLVDSVQVIWPSKKVSKIYNVKSNSILKVDISSGKNQVIKEEKINNLFIAKEDVFSFKHKENQGHDFVSQHLLMRQFSKLGPCIAAANVDNNIGDELFVGSSKGQASTIWKQNKQGVFEIQQELDSDFEDTNAVFVDVDNDKDLDLYVASGGSEFSKGSKFLQDRIYINDGKGHFTRKENGLPNTLEISSCVKPFDFDKDGDVDFFVGSRMIKGSYPLAPKSQLILNDNGVFTDTINKDLQSLGMITDAVWADINKDGWFDLVVVGDWMPITVFINKKGKLEKSTSNWLNTLDENIDTSGWWNTIKYGDFDNDGDIDFIVGNQGENGFVNPKKNKPVYIYKQDFDGNGSVDPIMAQYFNDPKRSEDLLPVHTRDDVMKQLVKLKDTYVSYKDFSNTTFNQLLNIKDLEKETLKAAIFSSCYIENLGQNSFKVHKLPTICQTAPINDILVKDFNNDGFLDALLVGNDKNTETIYGHSDALTGVFLEGSKTGFIAKKSNESGVYVPEQSNHIVEIQTINKEKLIIATQNNEKAKTFKINLEQ